MGGLWFSIKTSCSLLITCHFHWGFASFGASGQPIFSSSFPFGDFFFFPPISPPPPFCRGGECARTREAPSPPCSARHQETPPDRRSPDTCARQPGSGPRRRRWRRWTRSCPRGAPRPVTPLPPLPPAAAPGWYLPPAARALSELGRKGRLRGAGGAPPKSVWNYLRPRRMDGRHVPGTRGQRSSSPGSERGAPPAECAVWRRWWWWW